MSFCYEDLIVLYILRRVINLINKDIIKNWGVPESIKGKDIEFIFNIDDLNSDLKNNEIIQNLFCDDIGAKFCLYDKENNKVIFTMCFFIHGTQERIPFRELKIKLDTLCINDVEMRGKGIAKYYLEKLIKFGISNKISDFQLFPDPNNKLFKNLDRTNTLDLKALKDFYIKTFTNLGFNYKEDRLLGLIFKKL